MRVAVVSDTHFGDPLGTLVTVERGDPPRIGPGYAPFLEAVKECDYLVLLGDIIDFSVASYPDAYRAAKVFFKRLQRDGVAREIVYVPGNHDYDIWHTVEHQVNVINRLEQGQLPRAFKRSVPAVLDDRGGDGRLVLPDVVPQAKSRDPEPRYGDLFFDNITKEARRGTPRGPELNFSFAYPNLYLVTDEGQSVLLTHGHYFEAYWALLAELGEMVAHDDLNLESGEEGLSLRDMVGLNLPLNQLACTGIGQAQPLTDLAHLLKDEIARGQTDRVRKYVERLEAVIEASTELGWVRKRALLAGIRWTKQRLLQVLTGLESARYSAEFTRRPRVRERFRRYYRYSVRELERLRDEHGLELPLPNHVVFGHTHQPISWEKDELLDAVDGASIRFCNTGGWVLGSRDAELGFSGAEILIYETGVGMRSVPIRAEDVFPPPSAARPASLVTS